jgi:DNA ligase D
VKREVVDLELDGLVVQLSNPNKVYFPELGITKLEVAQYYQAVGPAILRSLHLRPTVMKRQPDGIHGKVFFQKRVPASRPSWLHTVNIQFPSGNTADELCPTNLAHVIWAVNMGCIEFHPWAVTEHDLDRPDELRIDFDPQPRATWSDVVGAALLARQVLARYSLDGIAKTSGSKGMHITVPVKPRWTFQDVRRAAFAVARQMELLDDDLIETSWRKSKRTGKVLVDFNQNARDHTVACAWSLRANPIARVSMPLDWSEVAGSDPDSFTIRTAPARLATFGDLNNFEGVVRHDLSSLLAQSDADIADGEGVGDLAPFMRKDESGSASAK